MLCWKRARHSTTSSVDDLPDEILDEVFRYLSSAERLSLCGRVCQRWRRVAQWRVWAARAAGDVRRASPSTRALMLLLESTPKYLLSCMDHVVLRLCHLRELTVHAETPLHMQHLAALHQLPHLIHLDVFTESHVLDEAVLEVATRLRTLVANEYISPRLLVALARNSRLEALHQYGRGTPASPRHLMSMIRVRTVYLCELTLRCGELRDAHYVVIGACFNLRSLQLYVCWQLRAEGSRAICRPRKLRRLHVTGARLLLGPRLGDMLELLPDGLEELVLSNGWFSDEHVHVLAASSPQLRALELWGCPLSAGGVVMLVGALAALERIDLDVQLDKCQMRALARHERLRQVRLSPEERVPGQPPERKNTFDVGHVRFLAARVAYPYMYFRANADGYHASLFYYWTRDLPLEPRAPISGPGCTGTDDLFA